MQHKSQVVWGLRGVLGPSPPPPPLPRRRGAGVVARPPRARKLGAPPRDATPRHAHFLPNTTVGPLVRHATDEDERLLEALRGRAGQLCESAARRAAPLALPLAVLHAEYLLDQHPGLHFVRRQECDLPP